MPNHHYKTTVNWTGNQGQGTASYTSYKRDHEARVQNKDLILCSSDPSFRGDPTRYNPEELLVVSLSSCHMLWYLHLCSVAGVIVVDYSDDATGTMEETSQGGGRFTEVVLYPTVRVKEASMIDKAMELHQQAGKLCFIANSCNFPVLHKPVCTV